MHNRQEKISCRFALFYNIGCQNLAVVGGVIIAGDVVVVIPVLDALGDRMV